MIRVAWVWRKVLSYARRLLCDVISNTLCTNEFLKCFTLSTFCIFSCMDRLGYYCTNDAVNDSEQITIWLRFLSTCPAGAVLGFGF